MNHHEAHRTSPGDSSDKRGRRRAGAALGLCLAVGLLGLAPGCALFQPEEEPRPRTMSEWMKQTEPMRIPQD